MVTEKTATTVGPPAGDVAAEDTDTDDSNDAASDDGSSPEGAPRGKLLVPALIAGLVVAVSLAATFIALWATSSDTTPTEVGEFLGAERPEVERVADEVINLLMNYDATNIDQVAESMLEISTGNFRKDYEDTFNQGLGSAIEQVAGSSRGQVLLGPNVSFRSASEAVAIARVSQTVQNQELPEGRSFVYLLEVTFVNTTEGGWKADRVELLSGQET